MNGKWIKEGRIKKGLTQEQLAELLHTSRQNISHYENGRRQLDPSLSLLKKLSEILDLTILIEKGEVINLKRETVLSQMIEDLKTRLEQHFRYSTELTLGELISQVKTLIKTEFGYDSTYCAFFPETHIEVSYPFLDMDWYEFFTQPCWGRFEFEIDFIEGVFAQGITFEIVEPEKFAGIMYDCLPQTPDEWENFSDDFPWYDIIDIALTTYTEEIYDLKICKIQVEF